MACMEGWFFPFTLWHLTPNAAGLTQNTAGPKLTVMTRLRLTHQPLRQFYDFCGRQPKFFIDLFVRR